MLNWAAISGWLAVVTALLALVTSAATILLALATFTIAGVTWWGVRENKHLIEAAKRQSDLLWENAVPYLVPENVEGVPTNEIGMTGHIKIAYAGGTIPARAVKAWVGADGKVRCAGHDLLTTGKAVKVLLVRSRAGSEPPMDWDEWLRRKQDGITYRVVMRWSGPGDHVTERAWWLSWGGWTEVPESLRG